MKNTKCKYKNVNFSIKHNDRSSEEGKGLLKIIFFLGITDTVGKLSL